MNPSTIIILLILALVAGYGAYSYMKKLKKGGGCCGEFEEAVKKVKVRDRNKKNYPYKTVIKIDGMSCGNCAARVENALNALGDTLAEVQLGDRQATVYTKQPADPEKLRKAVSDAGYTMLRQ